MNASDILNTVVGTLLYGINAILNTVSGYCTVDPATIRVLSTIAKVVFPPVFGLVLKIILEQAINRYSNRKRSQLNQFYSDVKVFQEILQETEKSFAGTGDNHARQLLKKNVDKCQKVCDQIESQSLAGIFSSSQQVEELDLLLRNSIHITNTYLSASSAGMKADLRHLRAVVHNMQAEMCQLQVRHEVLTEPNKVEELIVEELKPGILHVSWKETTAVDYYEVQYDRQTGHSTKVSSTQCLLDSMQLHFASEKFYNIRVRGVNGCGLGEWSESAVGKFTILPEQPQKPLAVHVNSSAGIALAMERPLERDGAKPVTHFVVEYHTNADKKCSKEVFPINNLKTLTLEGKEAIQINLDDMFFNTALTYHILISHRNEDGDSLPCVDCIETDRITPDVPVGLEVTYQTARCILIEWRNTNACTVDHYEVHWGISKPAVITEVITVHWGTSKHAEVTKNCYAFKQLLHPNKSYLIKVRAVNRRSQKSEFTEIRAKTEHDFIGFLIILVLTMLLVEVLHADTPSFFSLLVATIAAFYLFFTTCTQCINARLCYLLVLSMTGNVIIDVILYLRYSVDITPYVVIAVTVYTLLFIYGSEQTQLKHYMLEKNMVCTKLEEIQVMHMYMLVLPVIPPAFTLFWLVLMECIISLSTYELHVQCT